jgi:hypothetical protein
MKAVRIALFLLLSLVLSQQVIPQPSPKKTGAQTGTKKKPKPPCVKTFDKCLDEGCGDQFDPNLNRLKNMKTEDGGDATVRTLAWMKKLDDPENFSQGDTREELEKLGEGTKITVVAYLLVAKAELGGESCNCGFKTAALTDNHLVLVTKATVDKFPAGATKAQNTAAFKTREPQSETAEFTPRVRQDHPNFTREVVQPLIDAKPQKALLVRVTGQLLFDSEHFIKKHLVRVNNWEIHPVTKLEFCEKGNKCKATSDDGWKSLDDM